MLLVLVHDDQEALCNIPLTSKALVGLAELVCEARHLEYETRDQPEMLRQRTTQK